MATIYVLPSRHQLGQHFSEWLASLFPGVEYTPWDWPDLAESLAASIEEHAEAHVVYREDMDESLTVRDDLMRQFGAGSDDEIIETQLGFGQLLRPQWIAGPARKAA